METKTETFEIKPGIQINQTDLEKSGWKNSGRSFGFSQIWKNHNKKMLYDQETQKIVIIFKS